MIPDVKVEIAFTSGFATPAASRVWTDVSEYVEGEQGFTITRGRADQQGEIPPSRLTGLVLDNRDGRFTPENTAGAYYPNVKLRRPIRVTVTHDAVDYVRFVGFIDEWPVTWPDGSTSTSTVTVSASSRLARLNTPLRSVVEQEILADSPSAYYPLSEGEGATTADSIAPTTQRPLEVPTGATAPTFGSDGGPSTASLTAAEFAPGGQMRAPLDDPAAGWTLELFYSGTDVPDSGSQGLLVTAWGGSLLINSGGRLGVNGGASAGDEQDALLSTDSYNDGAVHHVAGTHDGTTLSLYVDGELVRSGAATLPTSVSTLAVGSTGASSVAFVASHVAATEGALSAARIAAHAEAGLTGFAGERSDERISRLAGYAGVPSTELSLATGSATVAHTSTTGRTPDDLLREIERTEGGLLFDAADGTLTLQNRGHRYNAASSFTLDAASDDVEADFEPRLDDQGLTNDVTASDGTSSRRQVDQDSLDEYGPYRADLSLIPVSVEDLADAAAWHLGQHSEPRVAVPSLSITLTDDTTVTEVLGAELSDVITVTGLPSQAHSSTLEAFVEGITDKVSSTSMTVTLNLSSTAVAQVWRLDSPTLSELGVTTRLGH